MSELTETPRVGGFVLTELPGTLSRDGITVDVPAATTYQPGTVLGQLSGTGHYVPYDNAASDGREVAAGILYGKAPNAGAAPGAVAAVIVNFAAEVREADLIFAEGTSDAAKDAALADLRSAGVKAR